MLWYSPFAFVPPLASGASFERREIINQWGEKISRNSSQAAVPGARLLVRRCVPEAGPERKRPHLCQEICAWTAGWRCLARSRFQAWHLLVHFILGADMVLKVLFCFVF